jgi:hypothetical protein
MRRAIVVVGALALALVIVCWQVGMGRVRRELGLEPSLQIPLEHIPRAQVRQIDAPELVQEAGRTQVPTAPLLAAGADELLVEVVDATDGSPLAEATVFLLWIDEAREREWEKEGKEFEDVLDQAEEDGESAETDEQGLARYPFRADEDALIVARVDSRWGLGVVEANEVESSPPLRVRIEVLEDFDLTVRVLEAEGGPAEDVPLSLVAEGFDLEIVTDEDGIGRFEHVGILTQESKEWAVEADVLMLQPPRVELGRLLPRREPVLIHLPPTGSVRIHVEDADGTPVEDGSTVYIFVPDTSARSTGRTRAGGTRFSHVELGLDLRAITSRGFGGQRESDLRFAGPLVRGEEVEQKVVLGLETPVLPLRVLLPGNRPFAKESLTVRTSSDGGRNTMRNVRTDEEGLVRLDLRQEPGETRLVVTVNGWTGKEVGAGFELALPLATGILEGRKVMLEPAPVLLAGRVVDHAGRPVVSHEDENGVHDGLAIDYSVPGGWCVDGRTLRTDPQGNFEVRMFCADGELLVRVQRQGKGGPAQRVRVGATDLRLVFDER